MATFLVAHGAWSAGWAWKKMRPRLRGHELWTPTYTGLGERVHLFSNDVKLDTHIEDVVKDPTASRLQIVGEGRSPRGEDDGGNRCRPPPAPQL